jgi:hypothetical protein
MSFMFPRLRKFDGKGAETLRTGIEFRIKARLSGWLGHGLAGMVVVSSEK